MNPAASLALSALGSAVSAALREFLASEPGKKLVADIEDEVLRATLRRFVDAPVDWLKAHPYATPEPSARIEPGEGSVVSFPLEQDPPTGTPGA